MAGQFQDAVGTLGRGISISPDLRRLLAVGDNTLSVSSKIGHSAKFHVKVIDFEVPPRRISLLIQWLGVYLLGAWNMHWRSGWGRLQMPQAN